jgi:hypothetical protein
VDLPPAHGHCARAFEATIGRLLRDHFAPPLQFVTLIAVGPIVSEIRQKLGVLETIRGHVSRYAVS